MKGKIKLFCFFFLNESLDSLYSNTSIYFQSPKIEYCAIEEREGKYVWYNICCVLPSYDYKETNSSVPNCQIAAAVITICYWHLSLSGHHMRYWQGWYCTLPSMGLRKGSSLKIINICLPVGNFPPLFSIISEIWVRHQ